MRNKKVLALVLAVMMAGAALAGCGGQEKADSGTEGGQDTSGGSGEEVVEIRMSNWRVEEIEAFEEINAEFMKEYPNIKPVYDAIKATEYDSKISIDLQNNTAADLLYIRPFDRGQDLYEQGYIEAITQEQVPNLANTTTMQTDVYTDGETGTVYAVPYMYINYGFMYNKTMFDELGLTEPETWEEFFQVCDGLKEAGKLPLAFGIKDSWILSGSVSDGIFGAFVGGEEGRQKLLSGELLPTSPEMVESFETMNKFVPYMPDNYEGVSYLDNVQMFAMGEAGIYPGGSFDLGLIQQQGIDFEMGVFAPPVVNKGDTRWTSFNGGAGIGLNAASEHKEEALIYMNWLMSEKGQQMIGDAAPGLFPCANIDTSALEDPLVQEMMGFGGENGELYTISWCMKLNSGTPTATSLADDNLFLMLQGTQTPEETAQIIQDGVAQWYEPWQNK